MLTKHRLKTAAFAAAAGLLLWLGLSPRTAAWAYEEVLMPRVAPDERLSATNGNPCISAVSFACQDGHSLSGMIYKHPAAEKIVIFFAGRSSNLAKCVEPAMQLLKLGVSVFAFEYAGFGTSPGRPSVQSLMDDGLAAYAAVIDLGYSPRQIIIYGESLGTAVATYVACRRLAAGMVLQSGFSSFDRLAKDITPFFRVYPTWMFSKFRMASDISLMRGHPPLLVIHGDEDDVINVKHSRRLAAAGGERTTLAILRGAGHFNVHQRSDWHAAMRTFLDGLDGKESQ